MQLAVRGRVEVVSRRVDVALAAAKPFGRYGPIERHKVRGLKVEGTELDRLRARKEMLLSMDPETAKTVIEPMQPMNLFQALALAKRDGRIIVPNIVHDRILNEIKDQEFVRQFYQNIMWTGTLIIYEKPDKPFGDKVVFTWEYDKLKYSITFKVPKQFRGKTNCALSLEYPDFELIELGNNRYEIKVSDESTIHLIEQFPKKDGWYLTEQKIPKGKQVAESKNARYLWRISNSYIGLLWRGYDVVFDFDDRWRGVGLDVQPSNRFGVALF